MKKKNKNGRFVMQSFTLGNLVSLCMKIINSVVVVGLYYGFLTTFSLGPSYLFLLRARVLDENKGTEGTEKKVAATTGFLAGQLMMFVSIYYAPFHVALGRPHTITFLALPYLLFHFLWNNMNMYFFDYEYTTINKMRNLGIQCVFLNNFIFQFFNNFLLPSSMLARLVNIYMFRCNNTMLFVTSSFFGWLIGHILFMKWVGLIVVWIKQNYRSNILIRSKKSQYYYKFLMAEWRHYRPGIFSMILVITCISHLGRMPAPLSTYKLEETKGNSKQDEEVSTEEASIFSEEREAQDKINKDDEFKVRTYYKRVSENLDGNKENSNFDFLKKKKEDYYLWFEKPFVTLLFDYNKRSRPNRYIRSTRAERAVRNETSQFFFFTCRSDGKERISFTYPPSLSTFFKMIQKKIPSFTREKASSDRISTCWSLINEEKRENFKKEFLNRIEALDKEWSIGNILEKTTRFCHNETKKEYLPKIYDPFLYGIYRGRIKRLPPFLTETYIKKNIGRSWINKIHGILLNINSQNFDQTIEKFHRKYFKKKLSFLSEPQEEKSNSEEERKICKFLFDVVITDSDYKTLRKNFIYLHKIKKKVPRWRYKLRTELQGVEPNPNEGVVTDPQIRSRRAKRVVFWTGEDPDNVTKKTETASIEYVDVADYRRELIRGSMRSQRRKTYIWGLYHPNVHSRVFFYRLKSIFDRVEEFFDFLFYISDIGGFTKKILRDFKRKRKQHKLLNEKSIEELKQELKERESRAAKAAAIAEIEAQRQADEEEAEFRDQACVDNAENWVELQHGILMRTVILLTISILRRYILPPLLITIKNCVRILLRKVPEWSEDFRDWKREVHFICNSTGGTLPKGEFPIDWYEEGIQIKVVYPFNLKPWHKSKFKPSLKARLKKIKDKLKKKHTKDKFKKREDKFEKSETGYLTVFGALADLPYGPGQERPPFFKPIYKELKKIIKKLKLLKNFKERATVFLKVAKELKNWIIETLIFITEKDPSKKKRDIIPLFDLRETYELKLNETKKESIMSNQRVHELSVQNKFVDWTNEKEKEFLIDKIKILRNQIEEISKEKQQLTITQTNSCKKPRYGSQIIESSKNFLETLDRKKNRLTRKFFFYFSFYIEQLSLAIFLGIINITRITIPLFVESTKKFLEKLIYKNEETGYKNEETGEKSNKKKNTISFISTIKNLISKKKLISKKNSYDLCSLSQAYVFYKLSQMKVGNFSKLKAALEYNICIKSFFVKNQIKGFFQDQGIFHYELKDKTFFNSEVNQWKNWLRSHYQYNLPQIVWARLVTKKWKKKINQDSIVINPSLTKEDSYEKKMEADEDEADEYEADEYEANEYEANEYEADSLLNLKKDSIYNLFCYKSIHSKENVFDMSIGIALDNRLVSCFLEKYNIRGMGEIRHRKYLDCRILNFWFRKKVNMESWIDTKSKKKQIKTKVQNYQRIDKITKTGLANKKRDFLDWMGMNEEILNRPITNNEEILNRPITNNEEILNRPITKTNFELFFFPEFLLFSSTYKTKPWVIPIKLLLFNFNENKKITKNIPSNDKEFLQFYNLNNEEDELARQRELEANKEKRIAEIYLESGKTLKKKTEKLERIEHLESLFAKFSYCQLRWNPIYFSKISRRVVNNIKILALMLQLEKPRRLAISCIKRGDLDPELLFFEKGISWQKIAERGIFFLDPIRASVQNDGQLIIYRTISISLVHKNKQKISKRYKKKIEKSITKYKKKKNYDLFVPEKILPPKRRREFRILTCLNLKKKNARDINSRFDKNVENLNTVLHKKKDLDKEKKNLIKFKYFLWPNFRLEDLACINRYWFNTTNGNRFSMIRMHMYKRFKNPLDPF
uniref:Protein TIC 214 n=1 Tax=Parrya pinnatifida TaxID=744010 RepID=A0A6M8Z962_9BRAS|nr:Ycf1.1 [Parrya pinnatifida]QKK47937.1 Ycf1.2 [Parrya pinnatifida]